MLTLNITGDALPKKVNASTLTLLDIRVLNGSTNVTKTWVQNDILVVKGFPSDTEIVARKLSDKVAECINILIDDPTVLGTAVSCLANQFDSLSDEHSIFVSPASSSRIWEDRNTSRDDFAIAVSLAIDSDKDENINPAFKLFQLLENAMKGRVLSFGDDTTMYARFERMVYNSPTTIAGGSQSITGYYDSDTLEQDVLLSMSCMLFFNRWLIWQ